MLLVAVVGVKWGSRHTCFHLFGVIGSVSCVTYINDSHSLPYLEVLCWCGLHRVCLMLGVTCLSHDQLIAFYGHCTYIL